MRQDAASRSATARIVRALSQTVHKARLTLNCRGRDGRRAGPVARRVRAAARVDLRPPLLGGAGTIAADSGLVAVLYGFAV